ncbi:unnamed protein product [Thlaspi arvense]|uniref:MATE efflux family protein n=1 Tax=Thlaspi arvense TaxID=13288 RepID=A0AAU9RZW1_THLAR|nr:unnamed protein product [Thlaspi arvense]
MEDPLLSADKKSITGNLKLAPTWRMDFTAELKNVSRMAAPMATVTVSQFLLPVISVMVAGHRGELQLSGVALATSFANVSGFSIMVTKYPPFIPISRSYTSLRKRVVLGFKC